MTDQSSFFRFALLSVGVLALAFVSNVYSYSTIAKELGSLADPVQITTCQQLQDISKNLSADYVLENDIHCGETRSWNNGAGFTPIGTIATPFIGTLSGQHYTIYDLYMHSNAHDIGLFGCISAGSKVSDVLLNSIDIIGINDQNIVTLGSLVGYSNGILMDDGASGEIDAGTRSGIGGLAGYLSNSASISNSYAKVNITNFWWNAGGLVGTDSAKSIIANSFDSGNVTAQETCYATCPSRAGGLIGIDGGTIVNSYATGNVSADNLVGGLIGQTYNQQSPNESIINSYSSGHVTGNSSAGGFIGLYTAPFALSNDYYDIDSSGQSDTGKGTPIHTKQMFSKSTFSNWDFTNAWKITEGHDYPHLQWETVPFTIHIMPIATQTIQTPFAIDIIANDPTFNGRIDFNMDRGDLDTKYVDTVNGEWTGNVIVDTPGLRNQMFVRWEQVGNELPQNSSNLFTVNESSGSLASDASVVGVVTDSNSQPLANVSVQLYANDPAMNPTQPAPYSAVTDVAGAYTISNALPGDYFARFTLAAYQVDSQTVALATNQKVNLNSMLYQPCGTGKVPVLLVPGIMGSTIPDLFGLRVYPRLPATQTKWDSGEIKLLDTQWKLGWTYLSLAFQQKKQGYVLGCTLFKVPYDWTLPIPSIRDNYLKPWIKKAEESSGQNQVDIIAHSMGGLVTRSYIQSPDYGKDIRKFAMVGTPNEGATVPYNIWEGGDPKTADEYSPDAPVFARYFYSNTLDYLMLDRANKHACEYGWFDKYEPKSCDADGIYKYINTEKHGLSVGQLMPVYSSALINLDKTPAIISIQENSLVEALDGLPCHTSDTICRDASGVPYYFLPASSLLTPDNTGVQTMFFSGNNKKTVSSIHLSNKKGKTRYLDGIPNIDTDKNPIVDTVDGGDGTVLQSSIKFLSNLKSSDADEEHAFLIKAFKDQLVSFITGTAFVSQPITDDPSPEIVVSVDGYAVPSLTATHANGQPMIFKDGQEQDDYQLQFSSVGLTNPTAGNYSLKLNSAEGGLYTVSIIYADPSNDDNPIVYQNRFSSFISSNGSATFTFSFDPSTSAVVTLDRSTQPPSDLAVAESADAKIALTWNDTVGDTNKDVDHYVIYAKRTNKSVYGQIGTSTTKAWTTSFDWSDAQNYDFVVQSVLKDASSTVLSEPTFYDPDEVS